MWAGFMGKGATIIYLISEFNNNIKCRIWASVHKVLKGFRGCDVLLKGPLFLFCLFVLRVFFYVPKEGWYFKYFVLRNNF